MKKEIKKKEYKWNKRGNVCLWFLFLYSWDNTDYNFLKLKYDVNTHNHINYEWQSKLNLVRQLV